MSWLSPHFDLSIAPDRLTLKAMDSAKSLTIDAPFSCSHALIADMDIFEHAVMRGLKELSPSRRWTFPKVKVVQTSQSLHPAERKLVQDAVMNAGAKSVTFADAVMSCDEHRSARDAYVRRWTGKN